MEATCQTIMDQGVLEDFLNRSIDIESTTNSNGYITSVTGIKASKQLIMQVNRLRRICYKFGITTKNDK